MTTTSTTKKIDFLLEDPVIKGQEWICVSFLSPEGVKNCNLRGFKFRGAFETREKAEEHAKEIQKKLDPDFHVYVGEGFKWLPWNQDPETIDNQVYNEDALNDLAKSYKENLMLKKQHEEERKKMAIEESLEKQGKTKNKTKERLQRKLMEKKLAQNPPSVEKVQEDEKKISQEKTEISELDEKTRKLKEAYAKLLEKSKKQ